MVDLSMLPFFLIGIFCAFVAAWGLLFAAVPRVFDKNAMQFWIGPKPLNISFRRWKVWHQVSLDEIHALQLVSEYCHSDDVSSWHDKRYVSYELNLVLEDGERINVVDHSKRGKRAKRERESRLGIVNHGPRGNIAPRCTLKPLQATTPLGDTLTSWS